MPYDKINYLMYEVSRALSSEGLETFMFLKDATNVYVGGNAMMDKDVPTMLASYFLGLLNEDKELLETTVRIMNAEFQKANISLRIVLQAGLKWEDEEVCYQK